MDVAPIAGRLDAYRAEEPEERRHVERARALIATGRRALDPRTTRPGHLVASAWVVDPPAQRALLVFHRRLNAWLQPGGHLEPHDDDLPAAATRETWEETGIRLDPLMGELIDVDVHHIANSDVGPHWHFDLRFRFEAQAEEVVAGSDAATAAWRDLRDISDLTDNAGLLRLTAKEVSRAR